MVWEKFFGAVYGDFHDFHDFHGLAGCPREVDTGWL